MALEADASLYQSTYQPGASAPTAFTHATILDGAGDQIDDATVLLAEGKVVAVGTNVAIPPGTKVVDARGRWVTPGIIDVHSHLGVYASPLVKSLSDGNEISDPNTAEVWAEHSVWPQDPAFSRARAGGVTTLQILPGSTNLFAGRSVVLRNVRSVTVQGMKFPGAGQGLKMACGENPKTVYGDMRRAPSSRMGSMAGYRAAWIRASDYRQRWDAYEKAKAANPAASPPPRDLELESMAAALRGDIRVHIHCYRADEIAQMFDLAKEFDYQIATIEHAVEGYKLGDLFRRNGACASMWADMWGYKMEMQDGIPENVAMVASKGNCAIVHSDSDDRIQQLNQDAAKAMFAGRRMGMEISKATAWSWISGNPARALGIDDQTGTLAPGKRADVVLWSGDPFSVYTRADLVLVDGTVTYDRRDPSIDQGSDFDLGHPSARKAS
ncbi:amidohydrolase [Sphingosinicella rhizophila]|uniref:Amidohydrolase n=1 Tax=Sphingosinicella rhizophila TaxID=3050082 RepID=A0ABU3Q5U0_9SPHN|nr:amidohydrolase [Sphingosinicella sp. GR2756]MDT9598667.1 amidohydrolase [Sphingosinicella sp. GR2756]